MQRSITDAGWRLDNSYARLPEPLFKATLPVAMGYTARMLLIDSEVLISEGPPVREREFAMAGVRR